MNKVTIRRKSDGLPARPGHARPVASVRGPEALGAQTRPAMTPQRDHLAERASMPSLDLHPEGVTPSTALSHVAVPVTIDTTSRGTQTMTVVREDQQVEHLKRQLAVAQILRDSWKRQAQRQDISKQLSRAVQECNTLTTEYEKAMEMIKTWQTAHARSLMTPPWMRALEKEVQAEADTFQQALDHDAPLHQQWHHCHGRVLNYVEAFRQHRVVYEHCVGEKKELENIVQRQFELLTRLRLQKSHDEKHIQALAMEEEAFPAQLAEKSRDVAGVEQVEQEALEAVSRGMAQNVEEEGKTEVAAQTVGLQEKQPTWTLPIRLMPTTPGSEAEPEGKACTYHPASKVSTPLGATHSGMVGHTQARDIRLALKRVTGQGLAAFTEFHGLNGLSPIQVSII